MNNYQNCNIALLEYRNTPVSGMTYSPSQILMSRMLKSKLPTTDKLLQSEVAESAKEQLEHCQKKQSCYYNRHAKDLPEIKENDPVRIWYDRVWKPAVVKEKHNAPWSYIVTTPEGQECTRNRCHLMNIPDNTPRYDNGHEQIQSDRETPEIRSPARHVAMTTQSDEKRSSSGRVINIPYRYRADYEMK